MDILGALLMLRALSLAPVSAICYEVKKNRTQFEGISPPYFVTLLSCFLIH